MPRAGVTVEYDTRNQPVRIHTIVVSTQHDEFIPADDTASQAEADRVLDKIRTDGAILLPRVEAVLPDGIRALFDDTLIPSCQSYRQVCDWRPAR